MRPVLGKVLAAALAAVEPGAAVKNALHVDGNTLRIGDQSLALDDFRRVLIVGAGKASAPMAAACEDVLGERLPIEGFVNVRYGHVAPTRWVTIHEAGHPMPDDAGVEGTRQIARLLAEATENDLVLCVVSGGGSALMTLPEEPLTLEDMRQTTDALLRCGATIFDFNTVRKHLDRVKGGGLAQLAAPATLVSLVLSDVVGNPLDVIASGPTVPDSSTWTDACAVFDRFHLWDNVPEPVADRMRAGLAGQIPETPGADDPVFRRIFSVIVGSNLLACQAAARTAESEGLASLVLSTFIEGEAREVARVLAGILREVDASGLPLHRPCCIVAGGETTVTIRGEGKGGRNQELALAAAFALRDVPNVLLASVGTDGNDGPTDAAGGWVDGSTIRRAAEAGLDLRRLLDDNDSYSALEGLGQLIKTGPTNTNVNDIVLLFAF